MLVLRDFFEAIELVAVAVVAAITAGDGMYGAKSSYMIAGPTPTNLPSTDCTLSTVDTKTYGSLTYDPLSALPPPIVVAETSDMLRAYNNTTAS